MTVNIPVEINCSPKRDSFSVLKALGFEIVHKKGQFYTCNLPPGWQVTKLGYWTDYFDPAGIKILSQFDKWAIYDNEHFVNVCVNIDDYTEDKL